MTFGTELNGREATQFAVAATNHGALVVS